MINAYLTEDLLGKFLRERFSYNVTSPRIKWEEGIFLPDFVIEDINLMIEYDGPRHYMQSKTVLRDVFKRQIYKNHGYDLISIPYFVQLDNVVINNLFKDYTKYMNSVETFNDYPHGFISEKVLLPAEFCSLGVKRFLDELSTSLISVKHDILTSMNNKISNKLKIEEIFPINIPTNDILLN